ncbi:MAG: DUF2889 domain-containing protein [Acidimicrobiia bacterium]
MRHVGNRLELGGEARDLVTSSSGIDVVDEATVRADVDAGGRLASLDISPSSHPVEPLLGRLVGSGFRDAVHEAFPDDVAAGTALALLLDDLPVATLISGYARLYLGEIPADSMGPNMKADICSGWRSSGTMMLSVRSGNGVPVTVGPTAPTIAAERSDDPFGWHDIGPLAVGAMRRRRLVDVHRDGAGALDVTAMFRDTHVLPDGTETVLHEYVVTGSVDPVAGVFTSCSAVPRVLPYVECPVAAASADRLVGLRVDAARTFVRSELRGTSTCTHLNDLLRSLGDIDSLSATLERVAG